MPTITKAPAVASNDRTSPPVRGSAFGFAETASTATVELGDAVTASTATVEPVGTVPGNAVVDDVVAVDVVEGAMVVVTAGSFTVTTGVQEQAAVEMVVVVVAILGEVVHGLVTDIGSGVVVTSLPSFAAASLTNRS
jgi:hypothetical protein